MDVGEWIAGDKMRLMSWEDRCEAWWMIEQVDWLIAEAG
jgi:hypothetical protein